VARLKALVKQARQGLSQGLKKSNRL